MFVSASAPDAPGAALTLRFPGLRIRAVSGACAGVAGGGGGGQASLVFQLPGGALSGNSTTCYIAL